MFSNSNLSLPTFLLCDLTVGKRKLQICCLASSNGVMLSCPLTGALFVYLFTYVMSVRYKVTSLIGKWGLCVRVM